MPKSNIPGENNGMLPGRRRTDERFEQRVQLVVFDQEPVVAERRVDQP